MTQENEQSKDNKGQYSSSTLGGVKGPGRGFAGRRGSEPVVKPKNFTATIKRLWFYFGTERKILIIIFLFILLDSLLGLLLPYLMGVAIDAIGTVSGEVNFRVLKITILSLTAAYILDGILNLIQGWMMAGLSQRIVMNLRSALFGKLQKLPIAFFDAHPHGEVMSRLSNDVDNVSGTISQSITQFMSGVIAIVGSLIMMIVLSPSLTVVTVIIVPLVLVLARGIGKKTRDLFKEQQVELGKLNSHIEETISGIQVVKAFNHEKKVIKEFDLINGKLYEVGLKAQIWSGFFMPLMNVINNISFALIACVGGILAVENLISIGIIASFLSYSRQFVRPLNELANLFNLLQSGVAGAERVFEIIDEQEEPLDLPDAVELEDSRGQVVFEKVSFAYRADVPILKNVSFESKGGSSTALVGPTGAGKTTIINLLTRFYDVTSGRILLDGRDIRDYTRDSLRRCFGIVLQDAYLFSGTIKENIKYGRPDATDEEMKIAAAMANADGFISRLPQQYDTLLSENGGNLSQGQRQLLAIARVMLAKPRLLILDEATSSIDTRTEVHIQDALVSLMQGRTSFIIAHRLNTIRSADQIMVIDQGKIIEEGNHDFLLNQRGRYYHMFFNEFIHSVEK